ncbi:MAG: DASS family sodium-coupled anion symporter [Candidatus Hydrogenedentes bacterium]|nr:DASS family sodium-coupled anion symporter [Candidatus Hydrogenedentota bacterium]
MSSTPSYSKLNRAGLVAGLLALPVILLLPAPEGISPEGHRAAAIITMMAIWWLSEAIPLAATALVPIALFPLLGVLNSRDVAGAYGDRIIFLFAGGFFIAMAMQKWNLHERIALNIVVRAGTNLRRLVLGFMIASAFLSMWISNTATALMMVPIAMAVIGQIEKRLGASEVAPFTASLLLGIAYACSIGGVATLIGTPPNGVLVSQLATLFPEAPEIGFVQWMMFGVPFTLVFLPVTWVLLTRIIFRVESRSSGDAREEIVKRLNELGVMSRGERIVSVVSICTALGWIFRKDIVLGQWVIPGWSDWFPFPGYIHDSTVAIAATVVLFLTPVDLKKGEFALDWDWAKRIPWGILILFGGGLALARAFSETGLVNWLGSRLTLFSDVPTILVIAAIALAITFLTEFTSNTATTSIMVPILGGAGALALGVHPLLLMVPAALSASCAFMMPVATPPNAVVFGSGQITIPQMARAGIVLNLFGAILVTLLVYYIAVPALGIELGEMPNWAISPAEDAH